MSSYQFVTSDLILTMGVKLMMVILAVLVYSFGADGIVTPLLTETNVLALRNYARGPQPIKNTR